MRQTESKIGDWNYYVNVSPSWIWKKWLKRNFIGCWLYRVFPFVFILILLCMLENDGVLIMEKGKFSFVKDTSNSICMILLFILSYFLGGSYPQWIKDSIDILFKYQNDERIGYTVEKVTVIVQALVVLSGVGGLAGLPFVLIARAGGIDWLDEMSTLTSVTYNLFLGLTWFSSIVLLIYVISGCFLIYKIMESNSFSIWKCNYEIMRHDLQGVARILNITISYSIFYVGGAIVMIINDAINAECGFNLTFYKYPIAAFILVFVVIIGLLYVLIPITKYRTVIEHQKYMELIKIESDELSDEQKEIKKKRLENINSSIFESSSNKLLVIISAICPLLTLLVQELPEFVAKIFL